jgi:hypothetical protein
MGMPFASAPSGSSPLFGRSSFHCDTKAAIERTLARGPRVAATRGIAVDANHQDLAQVSKVANDQCVRRTVEGRHPPLLR